MSMTRKDYELIAKAFKTCHEICTASPNPPRTKAEVIEELAKHLSLDLNDDNPKFDRNRFLKACGIEEKA